MPLSGCSLDVMLEFHIIVWTSKEFQIILGPKQLDLQQRIHRVASWYDDSTLLGVILPNLPCESFMAMFSSLGFVSFNRLLLILARINLMKLSNSSSLVSLRQLNESCLTRTRELFDSRKVCKPQHKLLELGQDFDSRISQRHTWVPWLAFEDANCFWAMPAPEAPRWQHPDRSSSWKMSANMGYVTMYYSYVIPCVGSTLFFVVALAMAVSNGVIMTWLEFKSLCVLRSSWASSDLISGYPCFQCGHVHSVHRSG